MVKCNARDCSHNEKGLLFFVCTIDATINSAGMCISCTPDIERIRKRKELLRE